MTISLGMLLKSCKSFNHLWHHPDELEDDLSLSSCLWNSFSNSNYRHGRIIPGLVWQGSSSITVFLTDDQLQYSSNVVIAVWYNSPNDGSYCIGTDLGSEDKWYKQLQLILQLQPGIFIPDDGGYCLNVITTDTGLKSVFSINIFYWVTCRHVGRLVVPARAVRHNKSDKLNRFHWAEILKLS